MKQYAYPLTCADTGLILREGRPLWQYVTMSSGTQARPRARKADVLTDVQVDVATGTFRLLADPTRLRIVHELLDGPRSVGALAEVCDVSASAISHQLRRLRDCGLVRFTRDGTTLVYELVDDHIRAFYREALYHADHIASGKRHR